MSNSERDDEECDARDDDSSTTADKINLTRYGKSAYVVINN